MYMDHGLHEHIKQHNRFIIDNNHKLFLSNKSSY